MTLDELYAEDARLDGEIAKIRQRQEALRRQIELLEREREAKRQAAYASRA